MCFVLFSSVGPRSTMSKLALLCIYGAILSCAMTSKVDSSNSISRKNERFLHRYLNAANILQKATIPTYCTDGNLTPRLASAYHVSVNESSTSSLPSGKIDVFCERSFCPEHSFCFMGSSACHPGYTSITKCLNRSFPLAASNPWYQRKVNFK